MGMNTTTDKSTAERLLTGLENGGMGTDAASVIAESLDPVLVYLIVRFLRESYPASDPAATAVLERVVALTSRDAALVKKCQDGEQDPVSQWFESEHSFGSFRGRGSELIELVVDKLET
jgi:hypothetical protein